MKCWPPFTKSTADRPAGSAMTDQGIAGSSSTEGLPLAPSMGPALESTLAPRPVTSDGSRAARVTTGAEPAFALTSAKAVLAPPPAMTLRPTAAAVADASPAATQRDGPLDHLAATPMMLRDIESLVSLGMVNACRRSRRTVVRSGCAVVTIRSQARNRARLRHVIARICTYSSATLSAHF